MKTIIKQTAEIVFALSPEEAMWLKGYVQNQMIRDESDTDREMRFRVFENLPSFEELAKLSR